jgi:uncharacterized protein (DUF1778 family)
MARKQNKSGAERKDDAIRVRITKTQRDMFVAAARRAGLTLSAWIIERVVRAARVEAHEAAKLEVVR